MRRGTEVVVTGAPRKRLVLHGARGFESHPLRQVQLLCFNHLARRVGSRVRWRATDLKLRPLRGEDRRKQACLGHVGSKSGHVGELRTQHAILTKRLVNTREIQRSTLLERSSSC